MKKALIIGGVALGLGALGWSGLWFAGQGEIAARMDAELAHLAQRGSRVSFDAREISGFPFGYTVTLTEAVAEMADRQGGQMVYRFPRVDVAFDVSAPTELRATLPPTFSAEIRPGPEARAANPGLGESLVVDFEADAAELGLSGLPGAERRVDLSATSLLAVHSLTGRDGHMAMELADLAADVLIPAPFAEGEATATGSVGLVDYAFSLTEEGKGRLTLEGQIEGIQLQSATSIRDRSQLIALLSGVAGPALSINLSSSRAVTRLTSEGEPSVSGTVTLSRGTGAAIVDLAEGRLSLRGEARGNLLEVASADPQGPKGSADIDSLDVIYRVPVAPTPEMQPFDLKFALTGLAPDAAAWEILDKSGKLGRDPAQIIADFDGTMRLTKSPAERLPGEAQPVAFGNVRINMLDMKALGAEVTARGDLEFLQPINQPQGEVEIRLSQVTEVLTQLVQDGVLRPDILLISSVMLGTYTEREPETGVLVSRIELGPAGPIVNGTPLRE